MNVSSARSSTLIAVLVAYPLFVTGEAEGSTRETNLIKPRTSADHAFYRDEDEKSPATEARAGTAITSARETQGASVQEEDRRVAESVRSLAAATIELEAQLDYFSSLQADWDDEGTNMPSENSIAFVRAFLKMLPALQTAPVRAYPTKAGDIGLVWEKEGGYADVAFLENGSLSFYARSSDGLREAYSEEALPIERAPAQLWNIISTL